MKRIAIGAVTGLAVWFGSALAAEAQQITPTGPLSITVGQANSSYTSNIYLPTPANFQVKVWVYRGTVCWNYSATIIPNPHTNNYNFSKFVDMTGWGLTSGENVTFKATLTILGVSYNATDLNVVVTGTRPTSKLTVARNNSSLAVQTLDKDRRKE